MRQFFLETRKLSIEAISQPHPKFFIDSLHFIVYPNIIGNITGIGVMIYFLLALNFWLCMVKYKILIPLNE